MKVVVANRGEIALRVIRTLKLMNIHSIALYTPHDEDSPHVFHADESVRIESYLNMDEIVEVALKKGADAIHPGYGFLAENSEFAKLVESKGMVFIGPSSEAIAFLGDKFKAKQLANQLGIPTAPSSNPSRDTHEIIQAIERIKPPVLLKAVAGGGGKGMKKVESLDEDLEHIVEVSKREALSAFGDDTLIVEKFIHPARHVEAQVIADEYGNVVVFGERECSLQRRHQKIIEEAPSTALDENERSKLYEYATKLMKAVGYRSAGTVEFLYTDDGNFYFLEVNARIQVEHPVSEMVTGYDLIELQIETAFGRKLKLTQEDVRIRGHAIEARLYAEDPYRDFLPQSGRIELLEYPTIPNVRIDYGVVQGNEIHPFYDPMIAKIVSYGESREYARMRLIQALKELIFIGPPNNQAFLIYLLESEEFVSGKTYTHSVSDILSRFKNDPPKLPESIVSFVFNTTKQTREVPFKYTSNPTERIVPKVYP